MSETDVANYAKLLHALATNDGFRAAMESDPRGAYAKFGIEIDADAVPEKVSLPSKEECQKRFGEQLDRFSGGIALLHGRDPRRCPPPFRF